MSERILALQTWIAAKGIPLSLDGKPGPQTRRAVIEVFRNKNAPAATHDEIATVAHGLGAMPRQLRAFAKVESAGGGWDNTGLLKCLWERHYLWRRVRIAIPFLSNPTPGGYTIDANKDGVCDSWEKLADASMRFGFGIAAECASIGKFQIMGAHWKALGYRSVADFYWQLSRTELAHYHAFARFIRVNDLKRKLMMVSSDPKTCEPIALAYNGKQGVAKGYHERIAQAYREDKG